MSADAFGAALAPLVEGAPRFLRRLADRRPFADDAELLAAAQDVARTMSEDEQVELIEAHPRIGAAPAEMSPLSVAEQGYDAEEQADAAAIAAEEAERVREELAILNEAYERRFGFRYVVFVAGRPQSAIIPLLEIALRNDRDAELRRAVDDAIDVAADRLARLRGASAQPEESA